MTSTLVPKTKGETYEGIAFQFCKVATVALFTGRFTLPVAAGLCALFYGLALAYGKGDTRCALRSPWLLIVVWGSVAAISTFLLLHPGWLGQTFHLK